MSAPERTAADEPQRYGTIVIVGGGCYGGYYYRQLQRAASAGAIVADRLLIVDRNVECAVAQVIAAPREPAPVAAELRVAEWSEFFAAYLLDAVGNRGAFTHDAIVPSPLMPHLMGEWLVRRAREHSVGRVATQPFEQVPEVPWERSGGDGTHYVSFATWMCPVNCIEPRICPHTKETRSWSMPEQLAEHARALTAAGSPIELAVLHCSHRAYGVGMFDTGDVIDADVRIRAAARRGAAEVIIGTVSHCHGALTRLVIGAPSSGRDSPVG
jgi:hypothetical protein